MDCVLIAEAGNLTPTLAIISSTIVGWGGAILALGLVIFVHELGHFLAAKACGVKCEKFYIGFDIPVRLGPLKLPSALCRFRWGETEYGIGILPLGGYVKMLGQDDNPRNQAKENERIRIRKSEGVAGQPSGGEAISAARGAEAASNGSANAEPSQQSEGQEEDVELDPRSFPAKPVWQRMVIISAGVLMNLVFAVIFAAVAYRMGVSYTPCVLGGTTAGDPAWVLGLQPGDQILQVGRKGRPDEFFRFDKDLMMEVTLHGAEGDMDLLVRRQGDSEPQWVTLRPTDRLKEYNQPAALGVRQAFTTKLAKQPFPPQSKPTAEHQRLQGGDEVVAVNGQPLPRDTKTGVIFEHHLDRLFAQHMTELVALTVHRTVSTADGQGSSAQAPRKLTVSLPPQRMRTVGLVMEMGPIVGIRNGSPAEKAGFQAGDVLVSVNGEDVGDPFTLAERLLPWIGKEVEFRVLRPGESASLALRATPVPPQSSGDSGGLGLPVALECLGLAFDVKNVAKAVEPDQPAAKAGLRASDEILAVQFIVEGQKDGEPVLLVKRDQPGFLGRMVDFLFGRVRDEQEKPLANWAFVHSLMNSVPDVTLELLYRRTGKEGKVSLAPVFSDRWYYPSRPLQTLPLSLERTAESWSDAWHLGLRETEDSLKKVVVVLQRLFTGQISYKSMGGPILILAAAGSEASHGMARLLVFLTFLSANLAVLNFLPIPALDGGHMVFLAAEWARGKPVNERLQIMLTLIGVAGLLSLMVLVFALDIHRFLLAG